LAGASSAGHHLPNPTDVGFVHVGLTAQLTLTLARLFRQDVTTMGLTAFEAVRRFHETLRRSPLSFQLGHFLSPGLFWPDFLALLTSSLASTKNAFEPLQAG
jgi:hypothetical protein